MKPANPRLKFLEIDKLPNRLVLELSAKTLGPYAVALRSRYKITHNELKQQKTKSERLQVALQKARGACKRMSLELQK